MKLDLLIESSAEAAQGGSASGRTLVSEGDRGWVEEMIQSSISLPVESPPLVEDNAALSPPPLDLSTVADIRGVESAKPSGDFLPLQQHPIPSTLRRQRAGSASRNSNSFSHVSAREDPWGE